MTTVVIQPSLGNPAAQRHWRDTIESPVPLGRLRAALSRDELDRLRTMHPDGSARFWGMTANHDHRMDSLRTGDVVLFTGRKHVQGVGEIGL